MENFAKKLVGLGWSKERIAYKAGSSVQSVVHWISESHSPLGVYNERLRSIYDTALRSGNKEED